MVVIETNTNVKKSKMKPFLFSTEELSHLCNIIVMILYFYTQFLMMRPQPDPTGHIQPLTSGTTLSTFEVLVPTTRSTRWPGLSLPTRISGTHWGTKWLSNVNTK